MVLLYRRVNLRAKIIWPA